jgi:hypothetical protein
MLKVDIKTRSLTTFLTLKVYRKTANFDEKTRHFVVLGY